MKSAIPMKLFKQINNSQEHSIAAVGESCAILGDALPALQAVPDRSVNLIFADPPYNIGKDFGKCTDRFSKQEYLDWCEKWISECLRVLKDNGTLYIMAATQFAPYLDVFLQERCHVLSRIIWAYDSSGVQAKRYFGSLYEPILMVVMDPEDYVFNWQDILITARTGAERQLIDYRKTPPTPYNTTKVPGNVWQFPRVRFKMSEYENHPTQKPEALLERIVRASSNVGDLVLDPFAGSFTTCAVAQRLGRLAVGIELNEDFFKIGLRRMGIATEWKGELLDKVKVRKTRNLSKRDHVLNNSLQLAFPA